MQVDKDLLRRLYQTHAREIYLYLYSLSGSAQTAEDLMQEVFLKALLSLNNEHPNFRAWLYLVARRLWIDRLRKEGRGQHPIFEEAIVDTDGDVLKKLIQTEQARELYRCLHRLPENSRQVVYLTYFSNLSVREIGKLLGLSPGNVRIIAYRARRDLRKWMEEE